MAFGLGLGIGKWMGRALDPTNTMNNITQLAGQTAWKPTRNFFRGVRGKGSINKSARNFSNRTKQTITGKQYDKHGNVIENPNETFMERHINNRATGALHVAGEVLSAPLTALGWGVGGIGRGAGWVGVGLGKVGIRGAGRMTREGVDFVGDAAIGGMELVGAMNKTYHGRAALFGAGAIGATALGASQAVNKEVGSSYAGQRGLQFYKGQTIDSIPGTITPSNQGVDWDGNLMENRPLDNMGADGNLALAMHNLR